MATTYYLKVDDENRPVRLLRAENDVEVWYQSEWRPTTLMQAELDGLGGSSDFYRINAADVARFKVDLNG